MKILYFYLKCSCIVHIIETVIFTIVFVSDFEINRYILNIIFAVVACYSPVFIILPSIIYEGEYKSPWRGLTLLHLKYDAFVVSTLGLGPVLVFLCKYQGIIREIIKKNEEQFFK